MSRKEEIKRLYLGILNREADVEGLIQYLKSDMSIEHIRKDIYESQEYRNLLYTNNFNALVEDHKNKITRHIIYSNSGIVIDYYQHNTPSNDLIFSVSGLLPHDINLNNIGFHGKRLLQLGYDVVFFNSNNNNFFQDITPEILELVNLNIKRQYNKRLGIGLCMGGFGTIKFSKQLGISRAILLSPWNNGYSIDKDLVSTECEYYVVCNYNNIEDKQNFEYICSILPKHNTTKIRVDDLPGVHDTTFTLRVGGLFSKFCREILHHGKIIDTELIVIDKE